MRLVRYEAEDGLTLDAAYYTGRGDGGARTARPLIVLTHGAWMNFYTGPQRFLPDALVPAGFDCLAINSRDRDLGGIHLPTERCFGMVRCRFEELTLDLVGALAWARRRGYLRFALVCHSYSGMRTAHHLSRRGAEGVEAVAMLSPPSGMSRVHRYWMDDYEGSIRRARELEAEGRLDEILVTRASARLPIIASAGTILSLWTQDPVQRIGSFDALTMPLLVTIGEKELPSDPAREMFERVASAWKGPVTRAVIPGAGHYYHESMAALSTTLLSWLRSHEEGR